jgi:hypothetical protein
MEKSFSMHMAVACQGHSFQQGRDKCAFEMVHGRPPLMDVDVPYPALFSTGYAKDLDNTGNANKIGFDHIGVIIDTMDNRLRGNQTMRLWKPSTNTSLLRICTVNEAFSTFPSNRIQLMKDGSLVHELTEPLKKTSCIHTRTMTTNATRVVIKRRKLPPPGRHAGKPYLHATRFGNDLE